MKMNFILFQIGRIKPKLAVVNIIKTDEGIFRWSGRAIAS